MRCFILVSVLLLLTACDNYDYVIINHRENYIEKDGEVVVPAYILEYKKGKGFLAVTRLRKNEFICESDLGGKHLAVMIMDEKEYRIINIDTGHAFVTENRDEYVDYLSERNIKHLLTTDSFEDAHFRKNKKLREAFERANLDLEKNILMGKCERN